MSIIKRKGPIVDPGLCRCCGATKRCRLLNVEYEWIGQKEIYSDMFMDTFGLLLSSLDGEPAERLICATCVTRLRDASAFRRQVLCCEELLLQTRLETGSDLPEIKQETEADQPDSKQEELSLLAPIDGAELINVDAEDNHSASELHTPDDSNDANMKEEPPPKPNKKVKKEKIKSKTKQRICKKITKKRKCKKNNQPVTEKLQEPQVTEEIQQFAGDDAGFRIAVQTDRRRLHNTAAIIEGSFVCPFDSSFSDYLCVYCRASFSDADALRRHALAHDPAGFAQVHNNKKLTQIDVSRIDCRLCPEPIIDLEQLKRHLSDAHDKLIYPITNEFLQFKLSNKNLTCIECGSGFSFFHALKKHMAEHFGTCICDICGAHYFEERMLILHQKTHQKNNESFPCADCGKNFKSKHSRYLHEARTHKKEPAYQCPKCDEVLFSYSLRYRHIIEVHGERRLYQCSHCDRSYDSRKSLREHNRRYHLKIFKHQCDLCDKRFYIPSRLKEHLATHTGERNYRCELCGKSYPRLRGLKVHLQSHSSEKKFTCIMCNATFTQNVNLKNHMKRQHHGLDVDDGYNP